MGIGAGEAIAEPAVAVTNVRCFAHLSSEVSYAEDKCRRASPTGSLYRVGIRRTCIATEFTRVDAWRNDRRQRQGNSLTGGRPDD